MKLNSLHYSLLVTSLSVYAFILFTQRGTILKNQDPAKLWFGKTRIIKTRKKSKEKTTRSALVSLTRDCTNIIDK